MFGSSRARAATGGGGGVLSITGGGGRVSGGVYGVVAVCAGAFIRPGGGFVGSLAVVGKVPAAGGGADRFAGGGGNVDFGEGNAGGGKLGVGAAARPGDRAVCIAGGGTGALGSAPCAGMPGVDALRTTGPFGGAFGIRAVRSCGSRCTFGTMSMFGRAGLRDCDSIFGGGRRAPGSGRTITFVASPSSASGSDAEIEGSGSDAPLGAAGSEVFVSAAGAFSDALGGFSGAAGPFDAA